MSVRTRLALFVTGLAVAAAVAALIGSVVSDDVAVRDTATDVAHDATATHAPTTATGHATTTTQAHEDDVHAATPADAGADHADGDTTEDLPPGLASARDGDVLTLRGTATRPRPGRAELAFAIVRGTRPVTDFDLAHERRMHVVIVRRDLSGFQHLHPAMDPDGTWRTALTLPAAGTYRIFADYTVRGDQRTLGADLHVAGGFRPRALPAPATTARDDRGLTVDLYRTGTQVAFSVRDGAQPVDDRIEPFLGARGHLVALRAGDLAYLHVHPDRDRLAFTVDLPSVGRYRLWVQYRVDGRIHTAAFTVDESA